MNLLITGANGFVGSALIKQVAKQSVLSVNAALRDASLVFPAGVKLFRIDDLGANYDWKEALRQVNVVIHTAACIQTVDDGTDETLAKFRRVNVEGTLNLARQAVAAGVNRFIFISSIKVNGETSSFEQPFTADDLPNPTDLYGLSKLEAEQGLQPLANASSMDVVIIRPPLVYGPGVKANFHSMMSWLDKGIPLPLGAIHNKRSLVALDNLVDLIVTCIDHPAAANQIFLVADGEDLSTTELLHRLAKIMGKPARLIPVSPRFLELGASVFGKRAMARRLCGSLQVDISKARRILGWNPPVSVDQGMAKAVEGFIFMSGPQQR